MKSSYNKVVIGQGLSGLFFGFYHPDSVVIGPPLPETKNPFVFFHDTPYSRKLLKDMGEYNYDSIPVMVKPKLSQEILKEKVGHEEGKFEGTNKIAYVGEGMELQALSISPNKVASILLESIKDRVITSSVISAGKNNVKLANCDVIEFETCINTAHFRSFEKLHPSWLSGEDIKEIDMYYSAKPSPEIVKNYIMYSPYPGVGKEIQNAVTGVTAIEYVGDGRHYEEFIGHDMEILIQKSARFVGRICPPPSNYLFVGRNATGNSHWQLEDSLYVAQEGFAFAKMIAEQKRFDEAIRNSNPSAIPRRISDLVLHIHSEAHDLLRETSWKRNESPRSAKRIKATSILEEGMDCIKLVLAILGEFDFTEREISEMFWNKSKICWDKFLTEFYGKV